MPAKARPGRASIILRRPSETLYNPGLCTIFAGEFMPIYAYRCAACGFAKDALQKMSDAPLTVCPSCGKPEFKKQVTAAGFQLKGSGWYVTDFKGGSSGTAAPAVPAGEGGPKSDTKSDNKADAAPAGAAAPAAPAAPATGTTGDAAK
jgi:putative FmdB family regulatory protein